MKRLWIFVIFLVAGLLFLAVSISWYILSYQAGNATMSNMMGQMMGGQYSGTLSPMPTYFWGLTVALVVAVGVGVIGAVYYVVYPEIRRAPVGPQAGRNPPDTQGVREVVSPTKPTDASVTTSSKESWSVLLHTSTAEERKVLEVLSAHNGVHLQKLIVKETGLSKLKTHRIISRFAGRGIVNVRKSGNTNEVRLAAWLDQSTEANK